MNIDKSLPGFVKSLKKHNKYFIFSLNNKSK